MTLKPEAAYAAMTPADKADLRRRFAEYCRTQNPALLTFEEAGVLIWLANRPAQPTEKEEARGKDH